MRSTRIESTIPASATVRGLRLNRRVIVAASCLLTVIGPIAIKVPPLAQPALAQSAAPGPAGVRLQAGIEKEDVDGDLPAAIVIYEKIAADSSAPRDVRAKALLRLAGCDEKLGKQAKQVYEQIVRDFADQPAAAQARRQLALLKQQENPVLAPTMTVRSIDSSKPGSFGDSDTDGERAVYRAGDNLIFGDLAGHHKQIVMKNLTSYGWVPSRDFSMVALNLLETPTRVHTLAVVKTDGTGYHELIREDGQHSLLGANRSFSMNWSWDHRYLLICDFFPKSQQVGRLWIVSVADGHRRELAHFEGSLIRRALFSPDGRFVSFEVFPFDTLVHATSRVFVVPAEGGEPHLIFESTPWQENNSFLAMKDWTPDGRFMGIKDVRQGRSALYLLPLKNGVPDGDLIFVRAGDFGDAYTTARGALVYSELSLTLSNTDDAVAALDPDGHVGPWRDLELRGSRRTTPSFSPDGSMIAYTARDADPNRRDIIVRDLSSGQEREIYKSGYSDLHCQYSPLNPKVFCIDAKEDGNTDLISIDVGSGAAEHVAFFPGYRFLTAPPRDDRFFYFIAGEHSFGDTPVLQWDRLTGEENIIVPKSDYLRLEAPSLDGRFVVRYLDGSLSVRPISGGDWHLLVSGLQAPYLDPITTPDGNWALYVDSDAAEKRTLYRVSTAGGKPQVVGELPQNRWAGNFFLSPDGRQILAQSSSNRYDLWILENFEPPANR